MTRTIYEQWLWDNARADSPQTRKDWDRMITRNEDYLLAKTSHDHARWNGYQKDAMKRRMRP